MVSESDKKLAQELINRYGIDVASFAGKAFLEWLLTRPRIARRPVLAKLLYKLLS